MRARLRTAYGHIRKLPGVGPIASRLVWAAKGALGVPVRWPTPHADAAGAEPSPTAPTTEGRLSTQLAITLAAVEGLWTRATTGSNAVASTERPTPAPRWAAGRREGVTFSVVVNTFDRSAHLRRTLQALGQLRHAAFEVIVVNGPSSDDTDAVLAEFTGTIRTASCPAANLAMSRNIGLAMAVGEVVAFIDDDAIPEPDWLDELERAYADPSVGGVGGFIRDRSGVGFQCKVVVADRLGDNQVFDTLQDAALPLQTPGAARYLSLTGANGSFRRAALDAIGGFDEAYSYFLEETDACLRLVDAGWDLAVAPDAEVHHRMAESALRQDDRTPKSLLPNVRSTAYFAIRNGAPALGLAAATDHLARHVERLKTDARWRLDHRLIAQDLYAALLCEIDAGLTEGVRTAFATPERRLSPFASHQEPARFTPLRRSRPADRLRLCLLSQDYPPGPTGGIGVWTHALAEGLSRAGHEVTVISRAQTDAPTVGYEDGVWVHCVAPTAPAAAAGPASQAAWFRALPPSIADYSSALLQEVRRATPRRRFDVVMGPIWDLEPAACLIDSAVPTVVSLHTPYALSLPHKPAWRADATFRARHVAPVIAGERAILAQAPHILANSEAIVADMAKAYDLPELADRAVVIPHGLPDRARATPPPRSHAERRGAGTVEILFVGRLEPRKGADVLLAAAATVLKEAPNARLTLVGDDSIDVGGEPLRRAFERRWAGTDLLRRVAFTGLVDDAELMARYAACDIFTAPSRYESFGLVLVEAMMFAKPCVGCRIGGIGEVVTDSETGLLVPHGDADTLATALLTLIGDPERRHAMGQAGRRRYEQRFTADAMVQATERYLREVRDAATIAAPAPCAGASGRVS